MQDKPALNLTTKSAQRINDHRQQNYKRSALKTFNHKKENTYDFTQKCSADERTTALVVVKKQNVYEHRKVLHFKTRIRSHCRHEIYFENARFIDVYVAQMGKQDGLQLSTISCHAQRVCVCPSERRTLLRWKSEQCVYVSNARHKNLITGIR